jgi:hypothetical protein
VQEHDEHCEPSELFIIGATCKSFWLPLREWPQCVTFCVARDAFPAKKLIERREICYDYRHGSDASVREGLHGKVFGV